jgi:hypothetical protein
VTLRPTSLLALLLIGVGLLGCDTTVVQPESQVAVEAYLQAGAPLPPVRLTRTVRAGEPYDREANAVRGATVAVDRLSDDSTVTYSESDSIPGLYTPSANPPTVASKTKYRLRVETADGAELRAATTVPGPVEIVETRNDTARYQSPRQPSVTIRVARPERADRRAGQQNVFALTTTSLLDFENTPDEVLRDSLTAFYEDGFDAEDDSLASLRRNSSGLLNEGNFQRNDDDTITIDIPWLAIAFFGPNEVGVNVVDDNYYDFLRSQQAQQGGFAPGEIPNIIENVEGGTGIFGSYARATHPILVRPATGGRP